MNELLKIELGFVAMQVNKNDRIVADLVVQILLQNFAVGTNDVDSWDQWFKVQFDCLAVDQLQTQLIINKLHGLDIDVLAILVIQKMLDDLLVRQGNHPLGNRGV